MKQPGIRAPSSSIVQINHIEFSKTFNSQALCSSGNSSIKPLRVTMNECKAQTLMTLAAAYVCFGVYKT